MSGLSRLTANQGGSIYVTSSVCQAVQGRDCGPPGSRGALWKRPQEADGVGAKEVADRMASSEPCSPQSPSD